MIWVFDLDYTLYNTDNIHGDYRNIVKDDYLSCLLHNLQGDKYVFTNATLYHANMVLKQMGIRDLFTDIIDRTQMKALKPQKKAFEYFMGKIKQYHRNETIVFFEDTIINLIESKKNYGWKTILIRPMQMNNKGKIKHIDYIFNDIHTAVESFSFQPEKCYIH